MFEMFATSQIRVKRSLLDSHSVEVVALLTSASNERFAPDQRLTPGVRPSA